MGFNNSKRALSPDASGTNLTKKKKARLDSEGIGLEPEFYFLDRYEGGYSYRVLTAPEIVAYMKGCLDEVQSVINLHGKTTRALMNYFKWNKDQLYERYFDCDNDAKLSQLFKNAGIVPEPESIAESPSTGEEECGICYTEMTTNDVDTMYSLSCGHKFCVQCWNDYLTIKIMDDGMAEKITCPANTCPVLIEDSTVKKLVRTSEVVYKYNLRLAKGFVELHHHIRWCVSPGCSNAIEVRSVQNKPVQCACKFLFCFGCGEEWHGPLTCNLLKKWKVKCNNDAANSNWILLNTKPCPKCGVPIQKNGGCSHMSCTNESCSYQFCWICMGPWNKHVGINAYNCQASNSQSPEKQAAVGSHNHFTHYFNRFLNNKNSLKFEKLMYPLSNARIEELKRIQEIPYSETCYLSKSIDVLCSCRNALMSSYAFAFYLEKTGQSEIYEENQRDLDMATDTLSEYLERNIKTASHVDMKSKLNHMVRYCEKRRQALLDHVYEGYANNYWKYNNQY